jgi:hypothetical protein
MDTNKPLSSRKRKQDQAVPLGMDLLPPTSTVGPVFGTQRLIVLLFHASFLTLTSAVNFPAIRPANKTSFQLYKRERMLLPDMPLADQQTVIACETQDVEFYSINKDLADRSNEQFACE